jgi:hypothetical protein
LQIISGTKSGQKEKLLASQFIAKFFKQFPEQMPAAIDAIFDLCEDDDITVSMRFLALLFVRKKIFKTKYSILR